MRKSTLALTLVAVLVLGAALFLPGMVGAHSRVTQAGLNFVFGSTDEPIITGMRQWLELRATDATTNEPAEGLTEVTATLTHGEHQKTLEMRPTRGTPGSYRAAVWFTQAGEFPVLIQGKNAAGESFELSFKAKVEAAEDLYAGTAAEAQPAANISLPVGSQTAMVNGREVTLDVPATIIDGRTLVPIRFIAEALGVPVHWDGATKTVHIGPEDMMTGSMPGMDHGSGSGSGSAPAGQPARTYTLKMFIDGFVGVGGDIDGVKNPVLQVKMGEVIRVDLINSDDLEHDWVVDELGAHSDHTFKANERTSTTFTAGKSGTFYYYCSVPGHRRAGMEGTIEVSM